MGYNQYFLSFFKGGLWRVAKKKRDQEIFVVIIIIRTFFYISKKLELH